MSPSPEQPCADADSPGDQALAEYMLRIDRGEDVDRQAFLRDHPEAAVELLSYFSGSTSLDRLVDSISMPFGPDLAPALEPIRDLAAQHALAEETADQMVGNEPTEVIVVESGVNQAEPPAVPPPEPEPEAPAPWPAWLWGVGGAVGVGLLALAIFWLGSPPPVEDDAYVPPLRPFVAEDVEWKPAGPLLMVFDEQQEIPQVTPPEALEIVEPGFTGRRAVRVTRPARCEGFSDLPARIREHPLAGEYRYLRFAWKKPGGGSIALVLLGQAPNRRFHYYAAGKRIGPKETVRSIELRAASSEWTVVERDLFADFGQLNLAALTFVTVADEPAMFDAVELSSKPFGTGTTPTAVGQTKSPPDTSGRDRPRQKQKGKAEDAPK